jgi:hypothetical protein
MPSSGNPGSSAARSTVGGAAGSGRTPKMENAARSVPSGAVRKSTTAEPLLALSDARPGSEYRTVPFLLPPLLNAASGA